MQQTDDNASNIQIPNKMERSHSETKESQVASYKILMFNQELPEQYKSLVFSTWLNSLRYGNDMFKLTHQDSYYKKYANYIKYITKQPKFTCRVAVLSDDPDVALGWSVNEGTKLHYVYVKKDFRNLGIATSLFPNGIKEISHITHAGLSIWQNKIPSIYFNPF